MSREHFITRTKRDPTWENKRILSAVTLNQLGRSSPTFGEGRNTLFFSYLDSSAHESLRSNRPSPFTRSLATPQSFGVLAIRDTLVKLAGLPSPPVTLGPCVRSLQATPSHLERISRYSFDAAHRFWKCLRILKSGTRRGRAGRGSSRQDSGNRTKSNYLRGDSCDVYETFREGYRKKKRKKAACTDSCWNYGLCGYFERRLPGMTGYGETTKREDVWNP